MKHRSSKRLFSHWEEKRRGRLLPERAEIEPADIRGALGDTFILAFNRKDGHPFRLAGTRVCALFGHELRTTPFNALWDRADAAAVVDLMNFAVEEAIGVVAGVKGSTSNRSTVDLELLLLPLRHCGQTHLRMIGTLAPLAPPYWLGLEHIAHLALRDYRFVGHPAPIPEVRLPALPRARPSTPARMRYGFGIYDGGQS